MPNASIPSRMRPCVAVLVMMIVLAGPLVSGEAFAHGGKTHDGAFTALQALQKGTELYDRLIMSGKLESSWETGLAQVEVASRQNEGATEYRVGFQRSSGDPRAVYIFLSSEGEYTGSNFDGKW